MQNPNEVADADGEYFEVYNPTEESFDLNGLVIKDNGDDSHPISSSILIAPTSYVVLCRNDNTTENGGLTCDYEYSGFILGNEDDEVIIMSGETVIDGVYYDGVNFPNPTGTSMNLDPDTFDAVSNDDGANWCESTNIFGDGDKGTPGTANDECQI
jgi:hypothetical protein